MRMKRRTRRVDHGARKIGIVYKQSSACLELILVDVVIERLLSFQNANLNLQYQIAWHLAAFCNELTCDTVLALI